MTGSTTSVTNPRTLALFLVAALLGSAGVMYGSASFQRAPGGSEPGAGRPNIILIAADTLRADHIGPCYGYNRTTAPHICNLSQDGFLFENTVSQAVWSLPSYTNTFLSQYSYVAGRPTRQDPVPGNKTPLAAAFRSSGYATAAFVIEKPEPRRTMWRQMFGEAGGFDHSRMTGFTFDDTIPAAINWLQQRNSTRPFFLFIQGYDAHARYTRQERYVEMFAPNYSGILARHPLSYDGILGRIRRVNGSHLLVRPNGTVALTSQDISYIRSRYDAGIRELDDDLGRFFARLKERGLYKDSIIVFFSDHGENLGEHPIQGGTSIGHAETWDHTIHVPLIIKPASMDGRRIEAQTELIDMMPTLLRLSGITPKTTLNQVVQGESLLPLMRGRQTMTTGYGYSGNKTRLNTVRTTTWKLVNPQGKPLLLYNLTADPGEHQNVADRYPTVVERLNRTLFQQRRRNAFLRERPFTYRPPAEYLIDLPKP